MVRDILMYLDRTYVKTHQKMSVYTLGITLFGKEVFTQDTLTRIQRLLMGIIHKDRNGEDIADGFLLKDIIQMMLQISKTEVYEPHFEQEYLKRSREFFVAEAQEYFENSTATDYLKRVKERLRSERERASRCMDPSTRIKIENLIKKCMIEEYQFLIIEKPGSGCRVMLENWKLDELALVYEFLGLVPSALKPCLELVNSYTREKGFAVIKDEGKDAKPMELIEDLIMLREASDELLDRSFSHYQPGSQQRVCDKDFTLGIRDTWNEIVNEHERFPEYLSLYIDSKLKKGKQQINENEFDQLFNQVIALFRHLRDKDIFERYYKTHLAKRLLHDKSQSDEAEKSFISKLKNEFGFHFTTKLEGMFADMRISQETNDRYKTFMQRNSSEEESQLNAAPPIDLSVQVLTTGFWPVTQMVSVSVPPHIADTVNAFEKFYLDAHSGRRLTWQYNMGSADVRMNGFTKSYELSVSSFQMLILMLFNENSELTYQQVLDGTKIPAKDIKRNLLSLTVKTTAHDRVLNRPKGVKTISSNTVFSTNDKFKSKKVKVKIAPVVIKQDAQQVAQTQEKVDEERKWQLDAAIVRIMKMRRVLAHRDLILEVTKQMSSRFMPSPDSIKKRIESLIERDYMGRVIEGEHAYEYIA